MRSLFYKSQQRAVLLLFLALFFSVNQYAVGQQLPDGMTAEQAKALALSKGASPSQVSALESKVGTDPKKSPLVNNSLNVAPPPAVNPNITGTTVLPMMKKDRLFGYDFFNNQNISFQPNTNLATPDNYQLGPGDALVISLWGAAENTYDVQVNRNGSLVLPNVGPIVVSGMTIERATEKIKTALKKVYAGISAPDASPYKIFTDVSLSNVRTVQVDIIGEVQVPGTYSLSALSTVLNALYACGGPTKQGTFRDIKLIRNGKEIAYFDVYKYLTDGSQEGNKTLKDQDVIIVGAYISRVNITGAVKRPGAYEIKSTETISNLMGYVNGFSSDAYRDVVKLNRIEGDRKKIEEITRNEFNTARLYDGDKITVGKIIDKIENSVKVTGAVYRPGDFEYTPNLSLIQLLEKASGIRETAYLERALITRQEKEGDDKSVISFSLSEILNGTKNILLRPNDVVQIFNEAVTKERGTISIAGAVKSPKSIPFIEGITLEDLVIMANGYTKKANTEVIDVIREVIDEDYQTVNKLFKISAKNSLDISNNTPFEFKLNDKITVRTLKGSSDQLSAIIEGEVNYPGTYFVENKNEKLLDLINKAGGLSPFAFEDGATLIRQNPYYNERSIEITTQTINKDDNIDGDLIQGLEGEDQSGVVISEVKEVLNNQKEFRVGINLTQLLKEGQNSKHNMVLNQGDRIIIPSIKETVKIEGEVLLPALIRYEKGDSFRDYVDKSGGFSDDAKRGKAYVIYPNGDVAATKHFLFFKTFPKLKPGAIVVVPKKQINPNRLSTQEVLGVTTAAATLALLIQQIVK